MNIEQQQQYLSYDVHVSLLGIMLSDGVSSPSVSPMPSARASLSPTRPPPS